MTDISPWLILIALGAFHGLNPAMGWLFAVALGLYRHSRRVVLVSLIPIALGHAARTADWLRDRQPPRPRAGHCRSSGL